MHLHQPLHALLFRPHIAATKAGLLDVLFNLCRRVLMHFRDGVHCHRSVPVLLVAELFDKNGDDVMSLRFYARWLLYRNALHKMTET